jgi:hypothetical protein
MVTFKHLVAWRSNKAKELYQKNWLVGLTNNGNLTDVSSLEDIVSAEVTTSGYSRIPLNLTDDGFDENGVYNFTGNAAFTNPVENNESLQFDASFIVEASNPNNIVGIILEDSPISIFPGKSHTITIEFGFK